MIDVGFGIIQIELGTLLLVAGFIALLLDAFVVLFGDYIKNWENYSEVSLIVGYVALMISFMYFSYSVLIADYSFTYVSDFVNNEMDFFLRLSAIWSGQAGSFFFWTFLAAFLYLIFRTLFRNYAHEIIIWRSFAIIAVQVAVLVSLTLLSEPFEINTGVLTDGVGLNPLLMNIWNVIHPPIIFIGYVLCLIPMAIGIARLSSLEGGKIPSFEGREKLDRFFDFMTSLAWLVLSSGIIIGGYWAYITLGWGGFWAWDPVETASLIPWLFITIYYHGKPFHRKSDYLGNYMISMTYLSTLIATYITRSGLVSSVHAFEPSGALETFLVTFIPENSFLMSIILRFIPDERMLLLFIVILVTFLLPLYLGIRNKEITRLPISINRGDFRESEANTTALKISYLSILIGTYIFILGLIAPAIYDIIGYLVTFSPNGFGSSITVDPVFYNTVAVVFGGIMLIAQFFCVCYPRLSISRKFGLIIAGVATGIIFSFSGFLYREGILTQAFGSNNPVIVLLSNFWTTSEKANLVLPLILLGIVGILAEFLRISFKEESNFIRKTSQVMLHLSFLIIMLGALLSANMITNYDVTIRNGDEYHLSGSSVTVTILDIDRTTPDSGIYSETYDTKFMLSTSNAEVLGFGISRLAYDRVDRMHQEVTIISSIFADIYVVTQGILINRLSGNLEAAVLQIKIIPYINILWAGCILLHFAILPLTISRFILLRKALSEKDREVEDLDTTIVPSIEEKPTIGGKSHG